MLAERKFAKLMPNMHSAQCSLRLKSTWRTNEGTGHEECGRSPSRYTDAAPLYRRSLAIREEVLGPDHPEVAPALNKPGGLLVNSDGADAHEQAGNLPSRFANDGAMP